MKKKAKKEKEVFRYFRMITDFITSTGTGNGGLLGCKFDEQEYVQLNYEKEFKGVPKKLWFAQNQILSPKLLRVNEIKQRLKITNETMLCKVSLLLIYLIYHR